MELGSIHQLARLLFVPNYDWTGATVAFVCSCHFDVAGRVPCHWLTVFADQKNF